MEFSKSLSVDESVSSPVSSIIGSLGLVLSKLMRKARHSPMVSSSEGRPRPSYVGVNEEARPNFSQKCCRIVVGLAWLELMRRLGLAQECRQVMVGLGITLSELIRRLGLVQFLLVQ